MAYLADPKLRGPAVLTAIAAQALLAWALLSGLAGRVADRVGARQEVIAFSVSPPPDPPFLSPSPSPPVEEPSPQAGGLSDPEGAAGRMAQATPVVAPPPPVVLASPPPVVAAPIAGMGSQPSEAAAAAGVGPGTGIGGQGGGAGGSGGPGGGGVGLGGEAQRIAGGLRDADYPDAAARTRAAGTVAIRIDIGSNGRVRGCQVIRSSGSPVLDRTTCRLVEKRFRYRPARDVAGRPVDSSETTEFTWGPRGR